MGCWIFTPPGCLLVLRPSFLHALESSASAYVSLWYDNRQVASTDNRQAMMLQDALGKCIIAACVLCTSSLHPSPFWLSLTSFPLLPSFGPFSFLLLPRPLLHAASKGSRLHRPQSTGAVRALAAQGMPRASSETRDETRSRRVQEYAVQ